MASEVESRKAPASPDALVQRRLADVCRRLRRSELVVAALLLAVVTSGYALGMSVFDLLSTDWPAAAGFRWAGYGVFLLLELVLIVRLLVIAYRRINPYYAAQQLEQTVPEAHNSLINWLDLHGQDDVPAAFRKNLGAFAARQAKQSDPEQIVDWRRHWVLGGLWLALVLGLLILLARGPQQFFSLMRRAFLPFQAAEVAGRTRIILLHPDSGDLRVSPNQAIRFEARIEGRVPDVNQPGAPLLRLRYQKHDEYVPLPLLPDDIGNWALRLPGDQVRTGFWYKITAGDAETPEYQVEVRAQPQAQRFELTYQYRPYLVLDKKTVVFPNQDQILPRIEGHQGTEVELVVRTNRRLARAGIELSSGTAKKEIDGQVLADDPRAFRCRWVLERSGQVRVQFTSTEGEQNTDRATAYEMLVLEDGAPRVVLTKPGQDVSLPANGTLQLEGRAEDDLGIKDLTLRLQLVQDAAKTSLQPKPYADNKSLRYEDGTYADVVDYQDFVALDRLQTAKGQPLALTPGMVIEYWLEALDNSDYPKKEGNLGKSQVYKVTIQPPDADSKKQEAERKQAQDRQEQHQKKQDQQRAEHKDKRQQNQAEQQPNQGDAGDKSQQQLDQLQKEKQETEDRLQKALDQQKQRDDPRGQGKGEDSPKSESKQGDQGSAQPQQKDTKTPEQKGQNKDNGQAGQNKAPGESKDAGQQPPEQKNKGPDQAGKQPNAETKNGQPNQGANKEPEAKSQKQEGNNNASKGENQGADKGAAKQGEPQQAAGESKDAGKGNSDKQPGSAKSEGPKDAQGNKQDSQGKDGSAGADAPSAQAKQDKGGKENATSPGGAGTKEEKTADGQGNRGEKTPAPPGQAKGADGNGPKSTDKSEGPAAANKQATQPQAKQGNPGPPTDKGGAKQTPPEEAKGSGIAKDERLKDGQMKEPTWDDIARLKDHMQKKDGLGDAAKELAEIGKNAQDPKKREAAREALAKSGRDPATGEPKEAEGNPPMGTQAGKAPDKKGEPKKDGQGSGAGQPKTTAKSKEESTDSGAGGAREGSRGIGDDIKPGQANSDFAGRGGNLQLENLKERVTPEVLKQAGLTEADWQRYLKQAEAYDKLKRQVDARRPSKRPNEVRGSAPQLPGAAPSQVHGLPPNSTSPLDAGQALPPPELREAQRRFSK